MTRIYISIGVLVLNIISNIVFVIFYRKKIYDKKIFFSLTAMDIFHKDVLKISNKFYRWTYKKNLILSLPIIMYLILSSFTISGIIMALNIDSKIKYIWLILMLIVGIISDVTLIIVINFPKFLAHKRSYRYLKSSEYGDKNFFEDSVSAEQEYNEFSKKLDEKFSLDFINEKGKVIKTFILSQIEKICFKKGHFLVNELNYLVFVDPKFILLNKEKLDFKTLSYLRIYLFKRINDSMSFY
ncbi:hypothetical protein PT313_00085 [Metamycoplasma hyosynoviae]|uniref:hypothetical protein n=3 Tax=Metamycoplasma hyosynoviae TaxID=29559 RepID=UPI002360E490|nr:hypothetical protein [Metamycoplasma hyosynoviae]MDD1373999.1 hypothetical protein [Metamycoplasma hyosynoviae]